MDDSPAMTYLESGLNFTLDAWSYSTFPLTDLQVEWMNKIMPLNMKCKNNIYVYSTVITIYMSVVFSNIVKLYIFLTCAPFEKILWYSKLGLFCLQYVFFIPISKFFFSKILFWDKYINLVFSCGIWAQSTCTIIIIYIFSLIYIFLIPY